MIKKWYQVDDERRKLTLTEVHRPENAGAVLIVCPQCVYELERNEEEIKELKKECLEEGFCEFEPDYEYDPTGETINCIKCGRLPEQK
jgi:hypothetical protein